MMYRVFEILKNDCFNKTKKVLKFQRTSKQSIYKNFKNIPVLYKHAKIHVCF